MTAFSDNYQSFLESVGFSGPISDSQDNNSQSYVTNHPADRQYIEFAPVDGLTSSDSCGAITAQAVNLRLVSSPYAAEKALMYLYESTIGSLGAQEIINHCTMMNDEQVAATAFYGPSVGVGHGDQALYLSTGREEITDCNATDLLFDTQGDGSAMEVPTAKNNTACWRINKRKTYPYLSGSVLETNAPLLHVKKPKRASCKSSPNSSASEDHEKNSNPKLDVIRARDLPPELLCKIVKDEQKAESEKDYIHVRARRGQATDSHSLAERVRRQKISDRMNALQSLIPGCSKITSKALVLEEIIKYVQYLQSQVEVLSMKLGSITSLCSFDEQNTGHLSQAHLLPLQALPDPMIAHGTAPSFVDHTYTVEQQQTPRTFIEERSTKLFSTTTNALLMVAP